MLSWIDARTPAGEKDETGNYQEGTIHYLVTNKLKELAKTVEKEKAKDKKE